MPLEDIFSFAGYSLLFGFLLGTLAERRLQRKLNGNAIAVGEWIAGAVKSIRETHLFAGDVEARNVGKLTTAKGETFLVTVERERA